jgi:hypothetical protein
VLLSKGDGPPHRGMHRGRTAGLALDVLDGRMLPTDERFDRVDDLPERIGTIKATSGD